MLFVLGVGGVRQVTLILLLSFPFAHLVPPSQFIAVWLVFPVFHWNPYYWPPLYTPRVPFETMLSLKLSHLTLSSPVLGCLLPLWLALCGLLLPFPCFLGWLRHDLALMPRLVLDAWAHEILPPQTLSSSMCQCGSSLSARYILWPCPSLDSSVFRSLSASQVLF